MPEKLKSRKFWTVVVGAVILIANDGLGLKLDSTTILGFSGIIMSYIFGQSAVDLHQAKADGEVESAKVMVQPQPDTITMDSSN